MARIAATIVGTDEVRFRCTGANKERLELARQIAAYTQGDGRADVVLLPAGFLAADEEDEVEQNAKSLASIFKKQVLLAGIDEEESPSKGFKRTKGGKANRPSSKGGKSDETGKESGRSEGYPFWVFASDRGKIVGGPWRQRSARSGQEVTDTTPRSVRAGDVSIGVLTCGELYNSALADSLVDAKPDLVVDLAHLSMKRFTKSLDRVAKTVKRPIYHVQHVSLNAAYVSKWRATPRGGASGDTELDWASYKDSAWTSGALWAEVKIWEI